MIKYDNSTTASRYDYAEILDDLKKEVSPATLSRMYEWLSAFCPSAYNGEEWETDGFTFREVKEPRDIDEDGEPAYYELVGFEMIREG